MADLNGIYELSFWLSPDLTEADLENKINRLQEYVSGAEGAVVYKGRIEHRRLAYPIKHIDSGYFGYLRFTGGNKALQQLKHQLQHDIKIMRFIIARFTPKEASAQLSVNAAQRKRPAPRPASQDAAAKKLPAQEEKLKMEQLQEKLEEILGEDINK